MAAFFSKTIIHKIFLINSRLQLTVCSCHVTYAFQSKSTLHSCLNVKELLAWNRREIWSLSDCYWTRTHNHLVRERILDHSGQFGQIFLIFPNFLISWVLPFINSWSNSYILVCLVIITLHFTFGERKICSTIKTSQILWTWL